VCVFACVCVIHVSVCSFKVLFYKVVYLLQGLCFAQVTMTADFIFKAESLLLVTFQLEHLEMATESTIIQKFAVCHSPYSYIMLRGSWDFFREKMKVAVSEDV